MKNYPKFVGKHPDGKYLEFCFHYNGCYHFIYERPNRHQYFKYINEEVYSYDNLISYGWDNNMTTEDTKRFIRALKK